MRNNDAISKDKREGNFGVSGTVRTSKARTGLRCVSFVGVRYNILTGDN